MIRRKLLYFADTLDKDTLVNETKTFVEIHGKEALRKALDKFNVKKLSEIKEPHHFVNMLLTWGSEHSVLGASSSSRWVKCPGSVMAQQQYPNETSEHAELGSKAHELAEDVLRGKREIWDTDIPTDVIEAVADYVNEVNTLMTEAGPDARLYIEEKVSLPYGVNQFGTADVIILAPKKKTVYVVDYKNGIGVYVDAAESWQPRAYGGGILMNERLDKIMTEGVENLVAVIAQPRVKGKNPITRAEWTPEEVINDFVPAMRKAAEEAFNGNPSFKAGSHCKFCAHQGRCPQATKEAVGALQFDDDGNLVKVDALSNDDLSKLYQAVATHFDPWKKELYGYTHRLLEASVELDNLHLAPKQARRKWAKDYSEIVDIVKQRAEKLGINISEQDFYKEPEEKSPAQLESLLKKNRKIIEDLVEKKSSGYNVSVGQGDSPATSAQDAFTNLDIDLELD